MNRMALSVEAVRAAAQLRTQFEIGPAESVCPYDLAIKLKIKVFFNSAPSLEGMYSPGPTPAIILNSERPTGRRTFTCGHEIGHHVFAHGYRIDELNEDNSSAGSPEEFLAQRFSSALLMPKIAVDSAFARRGWSPAAVQPNQFYIVARELGVAFSALVANLEVNLREISNGQAEGLRRCSLPKIKESLAGMIVAGDVFQIDRHWLRPTIDVEVGDRIIVPEGSHIESSCAIRDSENGRHFIAKASGITKVNFEASSHQLTLRISKREFNGLARYRHLEDSSDDE